MKVNTYLSCSRVELCGFISPQNYFSGMKFLVLSHIFEIFFPSFLHMHLYIKWYLVFWSMQCYIAVCASRVNPPPAVGQGQFST